MAAAYASLVSLLNTLDLIQIHPLLSTCFRKYTNESFRAKIDLFINFVEKCSEEAEELVRRIEAAAREAEDVIEVEAAHRIRSGSPRRSRKMPRSELKKIMEEMESIKGEIITMNRHPTSSMQNNSEAEESTPSSLEKTTKMVGFEGYLGQLLDQLTGQPSSLQIFPIVGMGGIGKTTLARNAYENLHIVEHFYVRAWATVSQDFNVREILLQTLCCLGKTYKKTDTSTAGELGEELYKILYGRRYLIVLDDVWSVEAWDRIKCFFPKENNGSRIVITTRQSEMVGYLGSSALIVDFLDDKYSWEILCEMTFGQNDFPPHLVEIGKSIVGKCEGLPLAIIVIGGFLRKSPQTLEFWEKVVKDKSLILDSGEGNKSLSILNLSYKHLPVWLKICFLYMGLFPEDHRIDVSQLIQLWVADGLIKPNAHLSLEETAESYLKELVDRNLVLVDGFRENKKFKTCYIHDLVRDLCLRIAEKENYFHVQIGVNGTSHLIADERNAAFFPQYSHNSKAPSILRPLIFHMQGAKRFKFRLLRVLFWESPYVIFGEVNLRFLNCTYNWLPSSISTLWSLQTLIIHNTSTILAPYEIWKMPQLRHIEIWSVYLPSPDPSDYGFVLKNLQTLEMVENLTFSEELCKRMPNVKDLKIRYNFFRERGESLCYQMQNIELLNKLESLDYGYEELYSAALQNLKLPSSLKELTLQDYELVLSDVRMIASLPHLEILTVIGEEVAGEELSFGEGEFRCLKRLRISRYYDLVRWSIADSSFPVLETLSLDNLSKLDEIPLCIGDIPTLETLKVCYCSESAVISAVNILEEQESLGNHGLQLQLLCDKMDEAEMLRMKIQNLGFTCQNLHISYAENW